MFRFTIRDLLWLTVVVALDFLGNWAWATEAVPLAQLDNLPTQCLSFSADGTTLVVGGAIDGVAVVELFDRRAWTRSASFRLGAGSVLAVAFSADDKLLFCAVDKDVVALSVADGTEIGRLSRHADLVYAVAVSPDGKHLATGGEDGRVCLWDAAKLTFVGKLSHTVNPVFDVAFDHSGIQLAAVGRDMFRVWPAIEANDAKDIPLEDSAHDVRFSPDGKLVVAGTISGRIVVAHVNQLMNPPRIHRLGRTVSGITFFNSAESLLVGVDKDVRLIESETGKVIRVPHRGSTHVSGIAIADATKLLAVGVFNERVYTFRAEP
jgi:WD40 repeat protein